MASSRAAVALVPVALTALLAFCREAPDGAVAPSLARGGDVVPAAVGDSATWWLTTGDRASLLARQPALAFRSGTPAGATITVDTATKFQTMDGFGYTLTGGSATLINRMGTAARDALLRELFTRSDTTLGVNYLRLSIGASDLSASDFTYDEVAAGQTDTALAQFSIAAEQTDLIPVLKQILAINPGIGIIATPWTPPTWMKSNRAWVGGTLLPQYYGAYARYFVKYLQAMQAQGITVAAITPQNEPLNPNNDPSLSMSAAEERDFVKLHLGPALRAAGLATKIVLYDHNADHPEYATSILDDPAAKAYVDGSAFHLYAGDIAALTTVHNAHPDRNVYFTEQYTASSGSFSGDLRWHQRNVMIGAPANWSRVALEWNLANDPTFGPHTPGGCSTCLGALTISGSTVTRNVAYYIVGHSSRAVPAGSVRVKSTLGGAGATSAFPAVAYRTPAGRRVLVVMNDGRKAEAVSVSLGGRYVTLPSLKVGAVATVAW